MAKSNFYHKWHKNSIFNGKITVSKIEFMSEMGHKFNFSIRDSGVVLFLSYVDLNDTQIVLNSINFSL